MEDKKLRKNPLETANFISKLFFWWTLNLFRKGSKGDLTMDDLYEPLLPDKSERLADALERSWQDELKKLKNMEYTISDTGKKIESSLKPSLNRAIIKTFWLSYIHVGLLLLFQGVVLRTMQPILQGWVLNYFDDKNEHATTKNDALYYATGLLIDTLGIAFVMHHTNLDGQQIGMRVRVACCALIYRKSLKLSKSALNQTAAGQVVNLLSNDVNRFDILPIFLNYVWIMPIQVIVVTVIMWRTIGVASFVGIGALLLMAIPIQTYISKIGGVLRGLIAQLTDRRVQLMNELIAGIQVVKMYAWEKPFNKIVSDIRLLEIQQIKHSSYLRGLYFSFMVFTERTTFFITLITFIYMGNIVTAEMAFTLASYFNILQMITSVFFPQALVLYGEAVISVRRIEEFLLLDEVLQSKQTPSNNKPNITTTTTTIPAAVAIELNRVSANWTIGKLPPTLCDVSLTIAGGQLCSLVGPVGSGKSSLLNILLEELPLGAGTVSLLQSNTSDSKNSPNKCGFIKDNTQLKISYASQDPWLFSATVRENIILGQKYEQKKYKEVAKVCSLQRDFKQLPNGDLTIVGERGMSLSGGQRARINLARAIYRDADVYLLDDPLSAVDARVAKRLFNDCILKYLNGKTRILVTHHLHFLKQTDVIVVMERGSIIHQGTFDSLSETSGELNKMLNRLIENNTKDVSENDVTEKMGNFSENIHRISHRCRSSIRSQDSYKSTFSDASIALEELHEAADDEEMISGQLSNKVYTHFFKKGGGIFKLSLLIVIFTLSQLFVSGVDYWLSYWMNLETIRNCHSNITGQCRVTESAYSSLVNDTIFRSLSLLDNDGLLPTNSAIYVYTICLVCCIIFTIARSLLFMDVCMNASRKLHDDMFGNILRATMLFFNTNSSGRVLNRFSKDVGVMDELLPKAMLSAIQVFLVMMGIFVLVIIVNVWMIIPIVIMAIIFYYVRFYFLSTAQDIKRLEGIAKSPVFSHVGATLNGLTTIRSHGKNVQLMLQKEFDDYQDIHSGAWYLVIATESAFGFILDLVCCIFIGCVCFSFILMDSENSIGGSVGLAISQSLILNGMLQYGIKQTADVQSQMTAVERIIQYTNLPQEHPIESAIPPPENWPSFGKIQLKNVFLSYREQDPPVLKNIDLTIEPGWKVGVVGRTGAGKSSLISVLFRLNNEGLQGNILIDALDTSSIGLQDLRGSIAIIPQEPVLFSENLRYNLDPFAKYTDDALWDALREVELADMKLDQWVTEGGTNFSVGQRQLICLARAILRNNRVLVLDEATANIDSRTDALIQKTVRSKFTSCTVITIAHRLNTIIDSDRVLVMDNGRIAEFDSPYELLFNHPDGHFRQMIEQTGEIMAEKLLREAAACHRPPQAISDLNNDLQETLYDLDQSLVDDISNKSN